MYVESLKALRLVVLFMTGFDFKNPSVRCNKDFKGIYRRQDF